jgi:hypothetical protein
MATKDKLKLLDKIAHDYQLDLEELKERYLPPMTIPAKGKRKQGRPRKIDMDDYVETEEILYDNKLYLVDEKNNVYTYDLESPLVVGERLEDGRITFFADHASSSTSDDD